MKQSLRKTPTPIHLAYRYRAGSHLLLGRNFSLGQDGGVFVLAIDLGANFQARDKTVSPYLDAVHLAQNFRQLQSLQCGDNLLRSRLIRAWDGVAQPRLQMCLDLGPRGRCLYWVQPRSLLMGGIEFDVREVLNEEIRVSRPLPPQTIAPLRNLA
jgi:hypothetical protein